MLLNCLVLGFAQVTAAPLVSFASPNGTVIRSPRMPNTPVSLVSPNCLCGFRPTSMPVGSAPSLPVGFAPGFDPHTLRVRHMCNQLQGLRTWLEPVPATQPHLNPMPPVSLQSMPTCNFQASQDPHMDEEFQG